METDNKAGSTLTIINNTKLTTNSVKKVISAKEDTVILETDYGSLTISGSNLEVIKIDLEKKWAEIAGSIALLKYGNYKKENLLKKIFK